MPVMIYDPMWEARIRAELDHPNEKRREEVWEGVLVVPPLANVEHQILVTDLALAFAGVLDRARGDRVLAGVNVSDREKNWTQNYREPDVAVYLASNPGKQCDTHWVGGPDVAVEIASPGEDPRLKLGFYAKVNTREVLILDREPWALELYQLAGDKLVLAGTVDSAGGAVLTSAVLPLTFRMQAGGVRPVVVMTHTTTAQSWTA